MGVLLVKCGGEGGVVVVLFVFWTYDTPSSYLVHSINIIEKLLNLALMAEVTESKKYHLRNL